mgnify:CR=1 FL=1
MERRVLKYFLLLSLLAPLTLAASIPVEAGKTMMNVTAPFRMPDGVKALYFRFRGEGAMNFFTFELS